MKKKNSPTKSCAVSMAKSLVMVPPDMAESNASASPVQWFHVAVGVKCCHKRWEDRFKLHQKSGQFVVAIHIFKHILSYSIENWVLLKNGPLESWPLIYRTETPPCSARGKPLPGVSSSTAKLRCFLVVQSIQTANSVAQVPISATNSKQHQAQAVCHTPALR